jgi:aspartyl-tRNA(Asn)/glutamyl-tRNA(Gln) amidotransferase subunit A
MNADMPTSLSSALERLEDGSLTSEGLVEESLKKAKAQNADLNAYLEIFDDALEAGREADRARARGEKKPLLGIPIAVKDNILMKGRRATAGSKILESYVASYSATVIEKLLAAGAIPIGRTNLDEFAMGSSTEHSAYGVTRNPHDLSRIPGGSSGGSAVAVASGSVLASLGSDTGGSIRQPAALCGVVGLKPTYGSVSRSGLIALGSSLDQIGPFTRTVGDARTLFSLIKGKDPKDSTSLEGKGKRSLEISRVIGVPWSAMEGLENDVLENFKSAVERFASLGFEIRGVELPHVSYALPAYYIIMPAEASANLARFDGVRYGLHKDTETLLGDYLASRGEGFGEETRRRILLGTYVLSAGYYDAYYGKAQLTRTLIAEDFRAAFREVGAVLTPTSPTPAFKIGEKSDPVSMYLADVFTVPQNLAGIPALSIPSGTVVREGKSLPLGVQLSAPHFEEETLFEIGERFLGEK